MKKDEMSEETKQSLWCGRCQRGIGRDYDEGNYEAGSICPICIELSGKGDIRSEDVFTLMTVGEYVGKKLSDAAYIKAKREAAKPKNVIGAEEVKREFEAKVRSQQQEIDSLREMIMNNKPNTEQSGSGKTVTKTLKKSSK